MKRYIYIYLEITKTQLHQTNNYFFYKSFQEVSLSKSYFVYISLFMYKNIYFILLAWFF
jgi:hypothetical protein